METLNDARLNINRVATVEELADTANDMFVNYAENAIQQKGDFKVAISGGQTPGKFFELLGDSPRARSLRWDRIQIFWVDERCVPPENNASNYRLAANTFLEKVPVPARNVHRMTGECSDYTHAVRAYEDIIREVFKLAPGEIPEFDLIMLGMGADGHVGSLMPNSYALFDTYDLVSAVYLMSGDYNRITLTLPVLRAAMQLIIMVSGPQKANIVKEVLQTQPNEIKYPVHTLWPILHRITWLIDNQAGRYL